MTDPKPLRMKPGATAPAPRPSSNAAPPGQPPEKVPAKRRRFGRLFKRSTARKPTPPAETKPRLTVNRRPPSPQLPSDILPPEPTAPRVTLADRSRPAMRKLVAFLIILVGLLVGLLAVDPGPETTLEWKLCRRLVGKMTTPPVHPADLADLSRTIVRLQQAHWQKDALVGPKTVYGLGMLSARRLTRGMGVRAHIRDTYGMGEENAYAAYLSPAAIGSTCTRCNGKGTSDSPKGPCSRCGGTGITIVSDRVNDSLRNAAAQSHAELRKAIVIARLKKPLITARRAVLRKKTELADRLDTFMAFEPEATHPAPPSTGSARPLVTAPSPTSD